MRRIHQSVASGATSGPSYITGGLKDDGSGATFADVYEFDPSVSVYTPLPSLPQGIYHHSSVLLANGTLVILGGVYIASSTGSPALLPYSTIYTFDTTSSDPAWINMSMTGSIPPSRRGASATLNSNGTKVFLFGGADVDFSTVYGDSWMLDLSSLDWQQVVNGDEGEVVITSVLAHETSRPRRKI